MPPIFRSLTKMSTPANCGLWYLHWHLVWYWQHFLFWHFVEIFPVKFCKKGIAGINFLFSITPLITFFLCLSIFYLCQFQQCSRTFSHEHEYQLTLKVKVRIFQNVFFILSLFGSLIRESTLKKMPFEI